jgi:hypothetical protein
MKRNHWTRMIPTKRMDTDLQKVAGDPFDIMTWCWVVMTGTQSLMVVSSGTVVSVKTENLETFYAVARRKVIPCRSQHI